MPSHLPLSGRLYLEAFFELLVLRFVDHCPNDGVHITHQSLGLCPEALDKILNVLISLLTTHKVYARLLMLSQSYELLSEHVC